MLTRNVRSAVGKSLRLFGEPTTSSASVDVAKNLEQLKHGPYLDRITKSQARECLMAASNLENPSKEVYHKLERILKKQIERNELTSRTAALTAMAAYKLGLHGHAERILKKATLCPSIMRRSLAVLILSGKGELDKALDQLEAVLCEDDVLFNSWNASISEEALDILCATIKERDDTQKQMARFRTLQRLITQNKRRCTLTVEQCLLAPIEIMPITKEPEKVDLNALKLPQKLEDQITEDFPHFMTEKPKMDKI